jgi:hypothetical protein
MGVVFDRQIIQSLQELSGLYVSDAVSALGHK